VKPTRPLLAACVAFTLVVSCGNSTSKSAASTTAAASDASTTSTAAKPTKKILQLAQESGQLTTLLKLIEAAGLTSELDGGGPFSLIAPSDAAFAQDKATWNKVAQNRDLLRDILRYHVIARRIGTKDLAAGKVATLEGTTIALKGTANLPTVNGFTVSRAARATNGTILVIDAVLVPPDRKLPA
jgi:uncharacterized surface protein with fasciclin (FAS1) repeats